MATPDGLPLRDEPAAPDLRAAAALLAAILGAQSAQITLHTDHHVEVAGRFGSPIAAGERTTEALAHGTAYRESGYAAEPIRSGAGAILGVAEVSFDDGSRAWSEAEGGLLTLWARSLAEHLDAVRALGARLAHFDLGFAAAGIGTWDWDLEAKTLAWDSRLHSTLMTAAADVRDISDFSRMVHPDDRDRVGAALEAAVSSGGTFIETFRMTRTDGLQRWIESRGRAVVDRSGRTIRLVGIAYDISETRSAADQLNRVLDAMGSGFLTISPKLTVSYVNVAATRLLSRSHEELVGADVAAVLPTPLTAAIQQPASTIGRPVRFAMPDLADDEADATWLEATLHPNPTGLAIALADVTESHRAEQLRRSSQAAREEAEAADADRQAAQARFALLARAGEALAPALDLPTALAASLDLVVAELADCAVIHLSDPGDPQQLRIAAIRHPEPAAEQTLARIFASWLAGPAEAEAEAEQLGTSIGLSRSITVDREFLERLRLSPQDLADFEALGFGAGVIVPLLARGRPLGTIALAVTGGRAVQEADLTLIEQLATRMAVAIDNARLFEEARAARETAELASTQMALLSEASQSLSATLDIREAVGRLARLVVPTLADWSMVTLVEEDGQLRDIGRWHRDPAKLPLVNAYADVRAASSTANAPVRRVIRTGLPVIVPEVDEAVIVDALSDPAARDIARSLNIGASAELPLVARGRTLGAITLLTDRGRRPLNADELAAAREVASRAAVALDNAQTFARQRRVAEELQHSMLTQPPEPDHLQIAVRYLPAAPTVQVGGDWYDAFLDRDGNTVLVIGDVMGHDIAAAAAMGQIRSLVRGIAFDRHESPSQVLTRVDEAMAGLAVGALATALLARIEQSEEEIELGVRRITWCSAGHPGPMLITPDGRVEDLVTPPGMLLGVDPTAPRSDNQAVLPSGSTVALFTDGLFERRRTTLDDGLELVRAALLDLAGRPLDELCDGLLQRMLPIAPEDDVALVAVRMFDQRTARPPEAGPREVPAAFDDPDVPAVGSGASAAEPTFDEAEFHPDHHAPALCRRFLEQVLLRVYDPSRLGDSLRFDLDLVATELVTNALRVAATRIALQVQCWDPPAGTDEAPWVRIAVIDDGPGIPEPHDAGLTDTRGRGLSIIAALSLEWGFEQGEGSKSVWARLAV